MLTLVVRKATTGLVYGLGWSGDRIPVGGEIFLTRPDLPGAHPATCTMGTVPFPGVKRPERGVDHPSRLAPRLKKEYC